MEHPKPKRPRLSRDDDDAWLAILKEHVSTPSKIVYGEDLMKSTLVSATIRRHASLICDLMQLQDNLAFQDVQQRNCLAQLATDKKYMATER